MLTYDTYYNKQNGESASEARASGLWLKLLRSLDMSTQLNLGSLSLVWDLTMKKGVGLPCTNLSGAGVVVKTSQHRGMKSGVEDWVS